MFHGLISSGMALALVRIDSSPFDRKVQHVRPSIRSLEASGSFPPRVTAPRS